MSSEEKTKAGPEEETAADEPSDKEVSDEDLSSLDILGPDSDYSEFLSGA